MRRPSTYRAVEASSLLPLAKSGELKVSAARGVKAGPGQARGAGSAYPHQEGGLRADWDDGVQEVGVVRPAGGEPGVLRSGPNYATRCLFRGRGVCP
jgi:hypothetical protein